MQPHPKHGKAWRKTGRRVSRLEARRVIEPAAPDLVEEILDWVEQLGPHLYPWQADMIRRMFSAEEGSDFRIVHSRY
jgi:hypothetical protein